MIAKNFVSILLGSGAAVASFYAPEVLAAVPTKPDIPIGDIVNSEDTDVTTLTKTILGWVLIFAAFSIGLGALAYWGWGVVSGLGRLQDDDNHKNFKVGNWLLNTSVGFLTVVIAGVIAYLLYTAGVGLIGGGAGK